MKKLQGKIAVITGGTTGIGQAAALLFHDEGARVFITGRTDKTLTAATKNFPSDVSVIRSDSSRLDDIDELPIYGRSGRVRVRNLKGPWQEVTVSVHWQREIDTSEFRSFLNEACESFRRKAEQTKLNPADLMPWKVLGRKWHLSRKGFPSSKRVLWNVDTLDTLLDQLLAVLDIPAIDWANKQVIHFRREGDQTTWASVHTKRRGGIDLTLFADSGKIALGKIANFGEQSEINLLANGQDAIKIRFTKANQVKSREWRQFLSEHASAR